MTLGNFVEKVVNGVVVLSVEHGMKGALESTMKGRIDELVEAGRLHIVVDLKKVPFVDSRDIGRIIRAHLSVRQAGGRVRLCNLSERVLSVLKMTRLDTVLELYSTEEEALLGIMSQVSAAPQAAASGETA